MLSAYVTVWCGFTSTFILGLFFFERITPRGPVRCTVTSASYENILMQRAIPALQERNCVGSTVFMQDVRETFRNERIISRNFPNPWSARSPDMNSRDFWLWGYLKDSVYQGHLRSLVNLKTSIQRHVAQIPRELLLAKFITPFYGCSM